MNKKDYCIDINCDLGEDEPRAHTRGLMHLVTSVNVACGGHAGSVRSMETCVELARATGTKLGAHPGFRHPQGFGRQALPVGGDDLEMLLLQQVGALEKIARRGAMPVHHIKLHGALYHAVENNTSLARRYLVVVQRYWPSARVYALAGGRVHQIGRKVGVRVWGEAFADRRYARDGTLVPRNRPGAVLTSPEAVVKQVHGFLKAHTDVDTICIHSDTANALLLAAKVVEVVRCPEVNPR